MPAISQSLRNNHKMDCTHAFGKFLTLLYSRNASSLYAWGLYQTRECILFGFSSNFEQQSFLCYRTDRVPPRSLTSNLQDNGRVSHCRLKYGCLHISQQTVEGA